jgi:hypothetical protein
VEDKGTVGRPVLGEDVDMKICEESVKGLKNASMFPAT